MQSEVRERYAIDEAVAEERAKALADKLEIAKNFLAMKLSAEDVAKATNLSLEIIQNLE